MMYSPVLHLKWGHQIARDQKPECSEGRMGQPRGHHYHFETCAAPCGAVRAVYVLPFASEKSKGTLDRVGSKFDAKCTHCFIDSWT